MLAPAEDVFRLIAEGGELAADLPAERLRRSSRADRLRGADPDLGHRQRRGQELDLAAHPGSGGPADQFRQEVSSPAGGGDGRHLDHRAARRGQLAGPAAARLPGDRRRPRVAGLDRRRRWTATAAPSWRRSRRTSSSPRAPPRRLLISFEDTVRIDGSAKDVYDFLNEAHLWTERLPHVARVSSDRGVPGLQVLEMDTRTKDGSIAHHEVRAGVLPAPADRLQADRPAGADVAAHRLLAAGATTATGWPRPRSTPWSSTRRTSPRCSGEDAGVDAGQDVRPHGAEHQQPGDAGPRQGVRREPALTR